MDIKEKKCTVCGATETTKWYKYGTLCKTCYNRSRYIPKEYKTTKQCKYCGIDFIDGTTTQKKLYCCREHIQFAYKIDPAKITHRKLYDLEHRHQKRINNKTYFSNRLKKDIKFKISCALRSRLFHALKNNQKRGSAVRDLGCTIEQLKLHLESLFLPGMNWDNYGLHGWHIDHIVPISSFDITNPEQLKKACHYTNLQPLWAEDNLRKGDKI
jgi:hypothetical protein